MPFPSTCQSPVTCDNRPSRKFGNTWLCLACFEYTERHNRLPIPEEPMSQTIPDQILAHLKTCPVVTNHDLQTALSVPKSSISSALVTLRNRGLIAPSDGTGTVRLVAPPAESALPDAVPEDTVQTSEADVLRAEIGRLTERLSSAVQESMQRAEELAITREKLRKCQHYSATADSVMEQMRRAAQKERAEIIDALGMDRDNLPEMVDELFPGAIANLRAEVARLTEELATSNMAFDGQSKLMSVMIAERDRLIAAYHTGATVEPTDPPVTIDELCIALSKRSMCSAVRLEWSPWQQDSGIWETYLRLKIGNIDVSIGQIVYQHGIYEAALHHSDRDGGTTTTITGTSLTDVGTVYLAAMQSAGLPVVSIPTLPESA